MEIRNDSECVLKRHEEIIEYSNKEKFMKYLYDFLSEYFRDLINNKHDEFKISYEPHEVSVTIFHEKFIARVEGGRYIFFSSYDRQHYLFDQPLKKFHPDYIVRLLEYTFEDFRKKSIEIQKTEYRPY